MTTKLVSISDLDLSAKCSEGYTFELVDDDEIGTGAFLTVLGAHAPAVVDWERKELNRIRLQAEMARRKGKDSPRTIEDDIEFSRGSMAVRVIGWSGFKEEFSRDNVLKLLEAFPPAIAQIREHSEKMANFTGKRSKA